MPAPVNLPEWDTTQVNMVATTGGHKTSGYASNEIPSSSEINYQLNLIYLWIVWLKLDGGFRFMEVHQNWLAPMLASWTTYTLNASASVTTTSTNSTTRLGRWLTLTTGGNGDIASKSSEDFVSGGVATQRAVAEFRVDATAIAGSPRPYHFRAGWQAFNGTNADESIATVASCKVIKTTASANWVFKTSTVAGAVTTTTTTVAATGVQKFRMELIGANDTGGARALLYIDDVLVATHTTNLPDYTGVGDRMQYQVYLKNDAAGVETSNVYVSPMSMFLDYL